MANKPFITWPHGKTGGQLAHTDIPLVDRQRTRKHQWSLCWTHLPPNRKSHDVQILSATTTANAHKENKLLDQRKVSTEGSLTREVMTCTLEYGPLIHSAKF